MIRSSLGAAAFLALFAAACGEATPPPSEEATRLTKVCVDEGGDPAMCECQGVKFDDLRASGNYSEDVLRAHVLSQEGNDEAADELMAKVSPKEFFEGLSSVGKAMQECASAS
jgi:hypothetical protein